MAQELENIQKTLIANVRRLRRQHDWSQETLAENSALSLFTIQSIESGRSWPEMTTFRAVAGALGVTPDDLLSTGRITSMEAIDLIRLKLLALEELERVPDDILDMLKTLKTDDFDIIRIFLQKITLKYDKQDSEKDKKQRA